MHMSQELPLHHAFIACARQRPQKTAIIDRTTERRITYGKALIGVLILARRIRKFPDRYIGIMVPTSAGCFLSVIATLMAGKVPVMINYSTGAEGNCRYAQKKCGFKPILTSRALLDKIGCPLLPEMIALEDVMKSIGPAEKVRAALTARLPQTLLRKITCTAASDDTAVILFTSGSEMEPKAVELSHRNITSNIRGIIDIYHLNSEDILMSILPLFHVFGFTVTFWMPMTAGMSVVTYANPLDYKKIPVIIREERTTIIAGTPSFFAGYVRESRPGDFQTLRLIVAGADKVPDWLREQYRQMHGKTLLEGYGTTETSPVISANEPEDNAAGSLGKPLPGVAVSIVDLYTGEPLPIGSEGKILVKGPLVMKGYLNDMEETSLRIRDGWYDTGDMGIMDERGFLWFRGRLKRFVKIGGEMISLAKVEEALSRALPHGTDCCVVELHDPVKGARLAAAITVDIDEQAVLKELAANLPRIAVPSRFIRFDQLPRMGSGKVDFRATTDMVRERLSTTAP